MCCCFYIPLDLSPEPDLLPALLARLSEEERTRLSPSLPSAEPLVAYLATRHFLCRATGLDNAALGFSTGPYGKPRLLDGPVSFNRSHTKGGVAVGISSGPIGVDLEHDRPVRPGVVRRFFTPGEQTVVSPGTPGWETRFLQVWTRKEACAKYTGEGLGRSLSTLDTTVPLWSDRLTTHTFPGHILSVCADTPPRLETIPASTLLPQVLALHPISPVASSPDDKPSAQK